nr:hypothetical protein [Tanacetum cinerariifolium]
MSSYNAQSAVTYTSISSDSVRPSWGIPLMNADELPEMDPLWGGCLTRAGTTTVEDQPHADDALSTAKSPGYIADSDSMEEDDDEDLEEDPNEEHEPEDDDEDP